jgi:hypothetical protein
MAYLANFDASEASRSAGIGDPGRLVIDSYVKLDWTRPADSLLDSEPVVQLFKIFRAQEDAKYQIFNSDNVIIGRAALDIESSIEECVTLLFLAQEQKAQYQRRDSSRLLRRSPLKTSAVRARGIY